MAEYPNIAVNMIATPRLTVCVREVVERMDGRPVVFVHGNVSSSPFFFPAMSRLPQHVRPIAVDLRGFGGTDTAPVDASRGMKDFADDVWATVDSLGLPEVDLVGWSMGGGVVMQMILDRPAAVTTATLISPMSPFGFGGTKGLDGVLVSPDGAGSGAGNVNPFFVKAIDEGDEGDGPASPLATLRNFYVAPGWDREDEGIYLRSMLSTSVGIDNYPGDSVPSSAWPGNAPGRRGVVNALSPTFVDLSGIVGVDPKPPILWIRGELDLVVSDTAPLDLARLGALGVIPGYPGEETVPPQPMVGQTRWVLDRYAAAGGRYREIVVPGVGHSPQIEDVETFTAALIEHLEV